MMLVPLSALASNPYEVEKGDTLWGIAKRDLGDESMWPKILDYNSHLKKPGRMFTKNGTTYVIIYPGEYLAGLNKYGILAAPEPKSVK